MRACGSRAGNGSVALYHFCELERIRHQVSHISSFVGRCLIWSFLMYHTTQHCFDLSTFFKKRMHTQNDLLKSSHQKLQQTQSGRKATQKNHSHTRTMKVPETCAQTHSQVMSPKSLRQERLGQFRQFLEILLKISNPSEQTKTSKSESAIRRK